MSVAQEMAGLSAHAAPPPHSQTAAMALIKDVIVSLSVELGSRKLKVRELMSLEPGAVVSLDAANTALLGIYVNGGLFARGELVNLGAQFGIKIIDIVDTQTTGAPA
jgi:flagellar motor switch protein FliN